MKRLKITVDGTPYDVTVEEIEDHPSGSASVQPQARAPSATPIVPVSKPVRRLDAGAAGEVTSPMAGTVIKTVVSVGQNVKAGDPVLHLEAMKMESVLEAPVSGTVKTINVAEGDTVQEGAVLMSIG